jgi:hypothetical protein
MVIIKKQLAAAGLSSYGSPNSYALQHTRTPAMAGTPSEDSPAAAVHIFHFDIIISS